MSTPAELAAVRSAYAKQVTAAVRDADVEAAFAHVPRENFLNPGPWPIFQRPGVYAPTPSGDPIHLYTNQLVGIVPEKGLNNGEPSLHAHWLSRAKPKPGEHVVHIGTGWGYYTAIMAEMVGAAGHVTGIEFEPDLAARAAKNLGVYPNVRVVAGDGATAAFDPADLRQRRRDPPRRHLARPPQRRRPPRPPAHDRQQLHKSRHQQSRNRRCRLPHYPKGRRLSREVDLSRRRLPLRWCPRRRLRTSPRRRPRHRPHVRRHPPLPHQRHPKRPRFRESAGLVFGVQLKWRGPQLAALSARGEGAVVVSPRIRLTFVEKLPTYANT